MNEIRVEISSEVATSNKPAEIKVYQGDTLLTIVTASVENLPGADGDLYPCVNLTQKQIGSTKQEKKDVFDADVEVSTCC